MKRDQATADALANAKAAVEAENQKTAPADATQASLEAAGVDARTAAENAANTDSKKRAREEDAADADADRVTKKASLDVAAGAT